MRKRSFSAAQRLRENIPGDNALQANREAWERQIRQWLNANAPDVSILPTFDNDEDAMVFYLSPNSFKNQCIREQLPRDLGIRFSVTERETEVRMGGHQYSSLKVPVTTLAVVVAPEPILMSKLRACGLTLPISLLVCLCLYFIYFTSGR